MSTDNLRKLKTKWDFFIFQLRRYTPKLYVNKNIRCLTFQLYDCSTCTKPITKKHIFDLLINNHPMFSFLSVVGFNFWYPSYSGLKSYFYSKAKDVLMDDDFKRLVDKMDQQNKELAIFMQDTKELVYYADGVAEILRNTGHVGKAEALTTRYLKVGKFLGLKPSDDDSIFRFSDLEEVEDTLTTNIGKPK